MAYLPPDESQMRGQAAYLKEQREKMPRKKPGDRYTSFFALLGAVAGLVLGIKAGSLFLGLLGLIGGGLVGTIIGTFVGSQVVKYQKSREARESNEGPLFR